MGTLIAVGVAVRLNWARESTRREEESTKSDWGTGFTEVGTEATGSPRDRRLTG